MMTEKTEMQATHDQRALLLVEDDKATLDILGLMIARKFPGLRIHKAENGKRGVEQFKEHLPDIVLTDINMPEMDGIRMAEEIRSLDNDTKFIVLTAYSDENYLERFSKIGFSDYMLKPLDFKKLFRAIEKCLT